MSEGRRGREVPRGGGGGFRGRKVAEELLSSEELTGERLMVGRLTGGEMTLEGR